NAHEHHRGGEAFAVPGGAPCTGIAAIGTTGDAHPVAIHQPDVDKVINAIDQVVELLHARAPVVELGEFHSASGTGPIVGEEAGEAARGGRLRRLRVRGEPAV